MSLTTDNVYGAIERRLRDEQFKVLHLHRDTRGDWGDDGGYIVSISSKNDKYYVHILEVNYNYDVSTHILDESDERDSDTTHTNYIACHSLEMAQAIVDGFVTNLDKCIAAGVGQGECITNEIVNHLCFGFRKMLDVMIFPYSKYPQDREQLLKLTKIPYIPDYTDPEYYV
jgi:hypothetical protein